MIQITHISLKYTIQYITQLKIGSQFIKLLVNKTTNKFINV